MIKPYNNGGLASVVDSVTQKVLIIDTTLRSYIPPQVRKIDSQITLYFWMWDLHHSQGYAEWFKYIKNKTCNIFTAEVLWETYMKHFI